MYYNKYSSFFLSFFLSHCVLFIFLLLWEGNPLRAQSSDDAFTKAEEEATDYWRPLLLLLLLLPILFARLDAMQRNARPSSLLLRFARLYKRTHFRNGFSHGGHFSYPDNYNVRSTRLDMSPSFSFSSEQSGERKKVKNHCPPLSFMPLRVITFQPIVIESIVIITGVTINSCFPTLGNGRRRRRRRRKWRLIFLSQAEAEEEKEESEENRMR